MRPVIKWADTSYTIYLKKPNKNGDIRKVYNGANCFSAFMRTKISTIKEISIRRTKCKTTEKYHDRYLKYITEMLQLDSKIGKNSFRFKSLGCKYKNLLVATLVRFLYEPFGERDVHKNSIDMGERFFKPLLESKFRYSDMLKNFCYFYREINYNPRYFCTVHAWKPQDTVPKTMGDFHKKKSCKNGVNKFFTK